MSILLREKRKCIKMEISKFINCTALQIAEGGGWSC